MEFNNNVYVIVLQICNFNTKFESNLKSKIIDFKWSGFSSLEVCLCKYYLSFYKTQIKEHFEQILNSDISKTIIN